MHLFHMSLKVILNNFVRETRFVHKTEVSYFLGKKSKKGHIGIQKVPYLEYIYF